MQRKVAVEHCLDFMLRTNHNLDMFNAILFCASWLSAPAMFENVAPSEPLGGGTRAFGGGDQNVICNPTLANMKSHPKK